MQILVLIFSSSLLAQSPNWSVNVNDYQYSMTITAFLNINGNTLTNTNDKVGAFVNGEVRGSTNIQYNVNAKKYIAYLTVLSNNAGETINFKIYDSSSNSITDVPVTQTFSIDKNVGSIFQSFSIAKPALQKKATIDSFNFKGITAVTTNISESTINVVLPMGSSVTNLQPEFTTQANAKVYLNKTLQISGANVQDFTNAVTYEVLSEDESISKMYKVEVQIANTSNPTSVILATNTTNTREVVNAITINFKNDINGLSVEDFKVNNGAVVNLQKINNTSYIANLVLFNQEKATIQLLENTVTGLESSGNLASNELTFNYDITPPFIKKVTNSENVFTITFSEKVKNVSQNDFALQGLAKDSFTISNFQKVSEATYQIALSKVSTVKNGNVYPTVKVANAITDVTGNPLVHQTVKTVYIDNEAPKVVVKNIEIDLLGQSSKTIIASDIEISATDNFEIATKKISKDTFTIADLGNNIIDFIVADINGNETIKKVTVRVVDSVLSNEEIEQENFFDLYPNPTANKITVEFSKNNLSKIELFNTLGALVLVKKLGTSKAKATINLDDISKGVYFLKVFSDKKYWVKRIVKN